MSFRTGQFDRARTGVFSKLCPAHAVQRLSDIDAEALWRDGKRLILLDVDHTLVQWRQEEFGAEVLEWLEKAKSLGFQFCILSNTRHPERLQRLSDKLGIATVRGRFKPSTQMYEMALAQFKVPAEQAVMIGDQLMTDVLGANRSSIDAFWVSKMRGPEFIGTKFNRVIERLLTSILYRSLITPVDEQAEAPAIEAKKPLWERTIVRQFIKFGIVGSISFAIDFAIRYFLLFVLKFDGTLVSQSLGTYLQEHYPSIFSPALDTSKAATPFAAFIASTIATFNSFLLNRSFTFKVKAEDRKRRQIARVYLVSYSGMLLNTFISTAFNNVLPGHAKRSLLIATVLAAAIVAVWNFLGQRFYAFRVDD